jgi:hypothetical protein
MMAPKHHTPQLYLLPVSVVHGEGGMEHKSKTHESKGHNTTHIRDMNDQVVISMVKSL